MTRSIGKTAVFTPEFDRPIITSRELAVVVPAILVLIGAPRGYNTIY